jgi:hypothetical protein
MFIVDNDSPGNAAVNFSLVDNCLFINEDGESKLVPAKDIPFQIDRETGMISTKEGEFLDYLDGYFKLQVKAVDKSGSEALAEVQLYVSRDNQRLRFIIAKKPKAVRPTATSFFRWDLELV